MVYGQSKQPFIPAVLHRWLLHTEDENVYQPQLFTQDASAFTFCFLRCSACIVWCWFVLKSLQFRVAAEPSLFLLVVLSILCFLTFLHSDAPFRFSLYYRWPVFETFLNGSLDYFWQNVKMVNNHAFTDYTCKVLWVPLSQMHFFYTCTCFLATVPRRYIWWYRKQSISEAKHQSTKYNIKYLSQIFVNQLCCFDP